MKENELAKVGIASGGKSGKNKPKSPARDPGR